MKNIVYLISMVGGIMNNKDIKEIITVFIITTFILVFVAGISYAYLDYHNTITNNQENR